jgi:hypothetical protein
MILLSHQINPRTVAIFTYQPTLRPALPCVYGPLDYREQRALFQRIDAILSASGLEQDFINLALIDRNIDTDATSAKRLERFARFSVIALRSNIARILTGLAHRDFCARLADSQLLQWFLHVGQVDSVKAFAKSSSDRFGQWVSEESLRTINQKFTALLAATVADNGKFQTASATFGLPDPISFDDVYFDSTCLKVNIHFPIDWVLLRDAARTLMKATVLIRKQGLKNRMPQEPLEFLSEMNTLCMQMAAKGRAANGRKQRKKVLREMKSLEKRIADHAKAHLAALKTRRDETQLSEAQAQQIIDRMQGVLDQLPAAIKQAHERIIGGRRIANDEKILSLYDDAVNVIVRGKAGAKVEFGNKLWLGENQDGIIVDYKLYQDNPSDSSLATPALVRLLDDQKLVVKQVWGDRGLASKVNSAMLERREIGDGFCPRDVTVLADKLTNEEGFRDGLKRRAGTEARIGIFKNVFLGRPLLAKGFKHRELAVGWAALTHNLWVVARMAEAEKKRKENQEQTARLPKARAA